MFRISTYISFSISFSGEASLITRYEKREVGWGEGVGGGGVGSSHPIPRDLTNGQCKLQKNLNNHPNTGWSFNLVPSLYGMAVFYMQGLRLFNNYFEKRS